MTRFTFAALVALVVESQWKTVVAQTNALFSGCGQQVGSSGGGDTLEGCITAGVHVGSKFVYYRQSDGYCGAADDAIGQYSNSPTAGTETATSSSSSGCDPDQLTSYYLYSTFQFSSCQIPLPTYTTPIISSTVDHFVDCLSFCENKLSMLITNPSPGSWTCYCGDSVPTLGPTDCGARNDQTGMLFTHAPQYTGQMRRRRVAQYAFCPFGQQACLSSDSQTGYECIDTQSELESCGGCMYASYRNLTAAMGVDCTSLPGVSFDGVICDKGQCLVAKCDHGYSLEDGECVELEWEDE